MFEDEQKNLPQGFGTFLVLWLTQSLSVIGSSVSFFALTIWIAQVLYPRPEQQPQLALALSGVTVFFAIPTVFGAPIAGAWADRHDRKTIMIVANLANAAITALLLVALIGGLLNIWLVLVFYTLTAIASAFHVAAFDSSYVMVVPPAQLSRANGMMQTSQSLSNIVAPGIAAALIALPALGRQNLLPGVSGIFAGLPDGTVLTLALDAATFTLASVVLLFLHIPSPKRSDRDGSGKLEKSLWADIRIGASYIRQRPPLIWLLATFTVFTFCASARPLFQPLVVKYDLANDWQPQGLSYEAALAFLGTLTNLGGLVGGFVISAWGGLKHKRIWGILVPVWLSSLFIICYGLSPSLLLTSILGFLLTFLLPISGVHSQVIWQTQTPKELQGRVFAVRRLIAQFTWPISAASVGWIGGVVNPGAVLVVLGVIALIFVSCQMFNPYLFRVEDKAYLDEIAAARAKIPTKPGKLSRRENPELLSKGDKSA